jgi:hypothetical protein
VSELPPDWRDHHKWDTWALRRWVNAGLDRKDPRYTHHLPYKRRAELLELIEQRYGAPPSCPTCGKPI